MLVYELPLTIFAKKDIPYIEAGEAKRPIIQQGIVP